MRSFSLRDQNPFHIKAAILKASIFSSLPPLLWHLPDIFSQISCVLGPESVGWRCVTREKSWGQEVESRNWENTEEILVNMNLGKRVIWKIRFGNVGDGFSVRILVGKGEDRNLGLRLWLWDWLPGYNGNDRENQRKEEFWLSLTEVCKKNMIMVSADVCKWEY